MRSSILLSATASLMMLGSAATFAQTYSSAGAPVTKPGHAQLVDPSSEKGGYSAQSGVGIINLKPGETVNTAGAQDYGSVPAGALNAGSGFVTSKSSPQG